jgi:hypothetical protein
MILRRFVLLALTAGLVFSTARCDSVDLTKTIEVTDVLSGYYDDGVVLEGRDVGQNRLLPSITFKLRNSGTEPINGVLMTVSFWHGSDDGEKDSREVRGIGSDALAPGATTEAITVRSGVGYTSPAARADFFSLPDFADWTAKLFAKRGGKIVPIGEYKIERRVIPHQRESQRP